MLANPFLESRMRGVARRAVVGLTMMCAVVACAAAAAGQKDPSASGAWVKLPAPGESTASAFVSIDNPTMYDIYLSSASADLAGTVEFRQVDAGGALKPDVLKDVTVPAYGSLELDAKGIRMVLSDLKRPLKEGETVTLTISILYGVKLQVPAVVKP
jgi:copper(I)-binding protein